ncbi:MAG: hypothetical protein U0797_24230 [Gemmataceae bacterium]
MLAAGGQGEDAGTLTELERADLRRRALDWLREEPRAGAPAPCWSRDPERLGADDAVLGRDDSTSRCARSRPRPLLPEAERAGWRRLWQDVEALRQKALGAVRK